MWFRVPGIELWHLQDFAASFRFFTGERLLTQEFPHKTQGFHFLLQALQFGFFATKYFDGVFHIGSRGGDREPPLFTIYGGNRGAKTSPEYKSGIEVSVSEMVRMSLQDGEPAIELLQQQDTRQLMRDGHLSHR